MGLTVSKKICPQCPFRRENSDSLKVETILDMVDKGIVSPCHQDMIKYTGDPTVGVEKYAMEAPRFQVCRGLVQAREKSGIPPNNLVWLNVRSTYYLQGGHSNVDIVSIRELAAGCQNILKNLKDR